MEKINSVFLLGPTAVGKTAVGVRLAFLFGGEIISADSRQVYRGLDIGSGKDLDEYTLSDGTRVPYHGIDVCDLLHEFSLLDFQELFFKAFSDIRSRKRLPIVVGGTGMYLDSILRRYDLTPLLETEDVKSWREELSQKNYDELKAILIQEKKHLHNTSEFGSSERILKAILLNRFQKTAEFARLKEELSKREKIVPLVLGTTLSRPVVRERIKRRLSERLSCGLIEEVEQLHKNGASWERLESLGLEYRFVSLFLEGKISSKDKFFETLSTAIGQFAKRQETWFRGMEKKGVKIHWLSQTESVEERVKEAEKIIKNLE